MTGVMTAASGARRLSSATPRRRAVVRTVYTRDGAPVTNTRCRYIWYVVCPGECGDEYYRGTATATAVSSAPVSRAVWAAAWRVQTASRVQAMCVCGCARRRDNGGIPTDAAADDAVRVRYTGPDTRDAPIRRLPVMTLSRCVPPGGVCALPNPFPARPGEHTHTHGLALAVKRTPIDLRTHRSRGSRPHAHVNSYTRRLRSYAVYARALAPVRRVGRIAPPWNVSTTGRSGVVRPGRARTHTRTRRRRNIILYILRYPVHTRTRGTTRFLPTELRGGWVFFPRLVRVCVGGGRGVYFFSRPWPRPQTRRFDQLPTSCVDMRVRGVAARPAVTIRSRRSLCAYTRKSTKSRTHAPYNTACKARAYDLIIYNSVRSSLGRSCFP